MEMPREGRVAGQPWWRLREEEAFSPGSRRVERQFHAGGLQHSNLKHVGTVVTQDIEDVASDADLPRACQICRTCTGNILYLHLTYAEQVWPCSWTILGGPEQYWQRTRHGGESLQLLLNWGSCSLWSLGRQRHFKLRSMPSCHSPKMEQAGGPQVEATFWSPVMITPATQGDSFRTGR